MAAFLSYIPQAAHAYVSALISPLPVKVSLTRVRRTKHGDYRKMANGTHLITLNNTENPYRFLITLIHELAHFLAFERYGFHIKPHGKEWKMVYRELMLPLLHPGIFPETLLPFLAQHFKNPKAATDSDFNLVRALHRYDPDPDKTYIFELQEGDCFSLPNGKTFIRGEQRRKRFECIELGTQKRYLVSPHAVVHKIANNA